MRRTVDAKGAPVAWDNYSLSRIMVTLPKATFAAVKVSAMKNDTSISTEIRTRLERSLSQEKSETNK
jgi:hypothetical protein